MNSIRRLAIRFSPSQLNQRAALSPPIQSVTFVVIMMRSAYQRLLPSTARSKDPSPQSTDSDKGKSLLSTCSVNPVACEQCRRKKAKCEGQRPIRHRCFRNRTECHYDVDVGESRYSALKKRYTTLDKEAKQLRTEVHQLRRPFGCVQATSENEEYEVFMHIRSGDDGNQIDEHRSYNHNNGIEAEKDKISPTSTDGSDKPDIESINTPVIMVPAYPWTVVAGDDVVSKLISQYFTFDYLYVFPPILRSKFVHEMTVGEPNAATCCSPLLVNAICAQQYWIIWVPYHHEIWLSGS
ncbi:C6 transcription factor [Pochonia chlamydosporia 170]|uniref:C6 transcription factor n=1 Tax=Pochonia chlamydosporia 170 TaxID=1380566 RepID=A0A179EZQ9_METCM|nr:C6 transcription factor [Pochonia chlamydosporia 170]OAQ58389.1 C6 transcription factor [Pochonia chlamydosporia 170]